MDTPDPGEKARDLEAILRRIKDVISARVMLSPEGLVDEVHVLASGSRGAKQLVRDAESALMTQGVTVDHKKISIAQLTPEPAASATPDRPRLVGVTMALNSHNAEARVRLDLQGATVEGSAQGPRSPSGHLRIAAEATLRAINQCVGGQVSLFVEECCITRVGNWQTATVVVLETGVGEDRTLVGSSLVRQDDFESVVLATLDAVNRRLPVWRAAAST